MNFKIFIIFLFLASTSNAFTFISDTSDCGELRRLYISAPSFPEKHDKYLSRATFMRVIVKEGNSLKIPFGEYVCKETDTLSGFVKIRFEIGKDGTVIKARCVESNFGSKEFISQIENYTSSYRFDLDNKPKDELIIVEYKYFFNQKPKKIK